MTLEEATTDDLFKEIRSRFPEGALLAVLKTPREGDGFDPEYECHTWNTYACIGLARVTEQMLVNMEVRDGDNREVEEEEP